jgi:large subunit ribosomal protein L18
MAFNKKNRRTKIKYRIRKKLKGSTSRPRLSVFKSNTAMYAQLIDDITSSTIVSASTKDIDTKSKSVNTALSTELGKLIAQKAKDQGIEKVVFDRNGYLYHGRIKALADGAREGGLKF